MNGRPPTHPPIQTDIVLHSFSLGCVLILMWGHCQTCSQYAGSGKCCVPKHVGTGVTRLHFHTRCVVLRRICHPCCERVFFHPNLLVQLWGEIPDLKVILSFLTVCYFQLSDQQGTPDRSSGVFWNTGKFLPVFCCSLCSPHGQSIKHTRRTRMGNNHQHIC